MCLISAAICGAPRSFDAAVAAERRAPIQQPAALHFQVQGQVVRQGRGGQDESPDAHHGRQPPAGGADGGQAPGEDNHRWPRVASELGSDGAGAGGGAALAAAHQEEKEKVRHNVKRAGLCLLLVSLFVLE